MGGLTVHSRVVRVRSAAAAVAVAFAVLGSACANPDYDPNAKRAELVAAGLTEQQARCVTSSMAREIGIRRLDAHAPATKSEHANMAAILDECHVDVSRLPS
jgi:hypothetical protein